MTPICRLKKKGKQGSEKLSNWSKATEFSNSRSRIKVQVSLGLYFKEKVGTGKEGRQRGRKRACTGAGGWLESQEKLGDRVQGPL